MKYKAVNIKQVSDVARGLKELKNQMIFVGGAVTQLYANEVIDDEIRETQDIDLTVKILNYSKWSQMQERLVQLGFNPDPFGHTICSFLYKNIPIDIMSSEAGPMGPANKWYKIGFNEVWKVKAGDEEIQVFSAPCYLATKFEAFKSRGGDYRASHDFEDIIYVLENRSSIVDDISKTLPEIRLFLIQEFMKILQSQYAGEILTAHLSANLQEEKYKELREKVNQIINL